MQNRCQMVRRAVGMDAGIWPEMRPDLAANEEAGHRSEEWKDFLKPYGPLDPEPGLGGILSVGFFHANATSFSMNIQ